MAINLFRYCEKCGQSNDPTDRNKCPNCLSDFSVPAPAPVDGAKKKTNDIDDLLAGL